MDKDTEGILFMINEQISICWSLYPARVNDILLSCYYDLVDLEMEIEEE